MSRAGRSPCAAPPVSRRLECDDGVIACDAVVLAAGLVPLRNVDGAVVDGVRTVYAQPCDDVGSIGAAEAAGRRAADAALAIMHGT